METQSLKKKLSVYLRDGGYLKKCQRRGSFSNVDLLGELKRDKLRILQIPWVFPPANGWPYREGKKTQERGSLW
jgi:hypothetical protein